MIRRKTKNSHFVLLEWLLNFPSGMKLRNIFSYFIIIIHCQTFASLNITFLVYFFCRAEIKELHQGVSPKKEKLTQWLSSSIAELRSEISELQASASNLTRTCHQRNLFTEEIREIRDDMNTFKLELKAIKSRQDKTESMLHELREELVQSSEDFSRTNTRQRIVVSKISNSLLSLYLNWNQKSHKNSMILVLFTTHRRHIL